MILLREIKIRPTDGKDKLLKKAVAALGVRPSDIDEHRILRESIDARKKPDIFLVYELAVSLKSLSADKEEAFIRKKKIKNASSITIDEYTFPYRGHGEFIRPVVVGFGPAGIFCALVLARAGFKPIVLERGKCVEERKKDVEDFWNGGRLNPESNVSFGEGGAGTFSDGKLNTLVKGSKSLHRFVLEEFVRFGASPEILYSSKPHIGTDVLEKVIQNMRKEILSNGGEIHFKSLVKSFGKKDGRLTEVIYSEGGIDKSITTGYVCLACGHSARDMFRQLRKDGIKMEPKPFAVGVRMEHPQSMIDEAQYGRDYKEKGLKAAAYKLTARTDEGASVYSFCMCPGGYVVNASSEEGGLVVNGMSYSGRNGKNANSAIVVAVSPENFKGDDLFCGLEFQEQLEKKAYSCAGGKIPLQKYGDFVLNRTSKELGEVQPCVKGSWAFNNIRELFPDFINNALLEAIPVFGRKIKGFDREDALMLGVETRTSSPVRIIRDEKLQSNLAGLYPCGEGAGYAGGITSAAMDGIRVAEAIAAGITTNYQKNDD